MADDPKGKQGEGAPQEGGNGDAAAAGKVVNQDDPAKKLAEIEAQQKLKDERIAVLEFENGFNVASNKYPHAVEYKDKILERVKSGMSVDEATVLILHGEGKLQTRDQIESDAGRRESVGGSADFQPPKGQKRPEEMTIEEQRAALVEEERKGTFKLVDN